MSKKLVYTIIFICITISMSANDGDTLKFNFYNKKDIQQWKGSWWYKKLDYIDPSKKYKKAILSIKLGCASYGCCVWDYNFHAYLTKPLDGNDTFKYGKPDTVTFNSVTYITDTQAIYQKTTNYEVARLITPYGTYMRSNSNGFNNNTWSHPYEYDITDYLPLLKDSFGIAISSGGFDGKKGFNMTVDLILIEGSSNYTPAQVYKPYGKSYSYKNELQIDSITSPFKFKLAPNENFAKFKTIITGHGQQGEFSPIEYRVKLNGNQIYAKRLWKTDCDKVAVQPQGGTWIFSRCNWCPGEKVETFDLDLSPYLNKTDSNEIDILFGAIENSSATQQANYVIAGNLITYTKKDSSDVSIDQVIAPSKNPNYFLNNLLCQGPIIQIKNNGIKSAKEIYIDYWVFDGSKTTYVWKGNLKSGETEIVNLPAFPWDNYSTTSPMFYAKLQKSVDNMVVWNDSIASPFTPPVMYTTSKIKFEIKTSGDNTSNVLTLTNELGDNVMTKSYINNNSIVSDTITLSDGCYRMKLTDLDPNLECGDGLNFWWSVQQLGKTSGTFKILNGLNNVVLKTFNPDFGGELNHQFTINKKIGEYTPLSDFHYLEYKFPDTPKVAISNLEKQDLNIFPNPSMDHGFYLDLPKNSTSDVEVSVFDLQGKLVKSIQISRTNLKNKIVLTELEKGDYLVKIKINGDIISKLWTIL